MFGLAPSAGASSTSSSTGPWSCTPGAQRPKAGSPLTIAWGGGAVQTGFVAKVNPALDKAEKLKVTYSGGSSATQMAQNVAEGGKSGYDLLFSSIPSYNLGVEADVLSPLRMSFLAKEAATSATRLNAGLGMGVALNTTSYGVAYNPAVLAKDGLPTPTDVQDLWNPIYRGVLGMYVPPYSSGIQMIAIVTHLLGGKPSNQQVGINKLAPLAKYATLASSLSDMETAVAGGKVGIWFETSGAANAMNAQGLNVKMVFPTNQTFGIDILATIPTRSTNKGGACDALAWLLSKTGNYTLASVVGNKPIRPGVPNPPGLAPTSVSSITPLLQGAPSSESFTQMWNEATS